MPVGKSFQEITVHDVYEINQKEGIIQLIDVRELDEYEDYHATIGSNIPLSLLKTGQGFDKLPKDHSTPIYLICRSGKRSATACDILHQAGYTKLFNVLGGMLAWQAEALPLAE